VHYVEGVECFDKLQGDRNVESLSIEPQHKFLSVSRRIYRKSMKKFDLRLSILKEYCGALTGVGSLFIFLNLKEGFIRIGF